MLEEKLESVVLEMDVCIVDRCCSSFLHLALSLSLIIEGRRECHCNGVFMGSFWLESSSYLHSALNPDAAKGINQYSFAIDNEDDVSVAYGAFAHNIPMSLNPSTQSLPEISILELSMCTKVKPRRR